MTELETLQRAKMYMDKLANGIDPITDLEAPEQDIINHVRLARCFFYVSQVLGKVIENGGLEEKSPKAKKLPFSLDLRKREQMTYSEEPVTITVFTQRINTLIDTETTKALKTTTLTRWLTESGLLEPLPAAEGRHTKRATAQGEKLGIRNEERMGQYGSYTAVTYNLNAQHFLLDNLDSILSLEAEKTRNEGLPWTGEENQKLREYFLQGMAPDDIGEILRRTPSSVKKQLKKIGPF